MLSFVRAFASVFSARLTIFALNCETYSCMTRLDVQVRVPHVEVASSRRSRPSRRDTGRPCRARSAPAPSRRTRCRAPRSTCSTARRLTSHSHGPGSVSSKSLTIEHEPPLGRGEHPEIRQMRVPAALHRQPRPRRRREIMGHDHRRPAIERKRRDQHPPVTDRHQLRHPRLRLTLEQVDRISTSRRAARTSHDWSAAPRPGPPCRVRRAQRPTSAAPPPQASSAVCLQTRCSQPRSSVVAIAIAILSRYPATPMFAEPIAPGDGASTTP